MIWLTAAIAFFALCQFGVGVVAYVYGGKQTDKIIAADERLADAMEKSVREADISLKQTQESFRDDQRAWLAPISGTVILDESHPLRIDVIFQNTGKTPALKISTIVDWKSIPPGQPVNIEWSSHVRRMDSGTLYPNGRAGMFAKNETVSSKQQLDSIRSGKNTFYFFGSIDYKDVYGRKHWSHLCNIVKSDFSLNPCPIYNEAN